VVVVGVRRRQHQVGYWFNPAAIDSRRPLFETAAAERNTLIECRILVTTAELSHKKIP